MKRAATILALAILLIGCSSSVEPDEATPGEMVGVIIGLGEGTPAITLPTHTRVDHPMRVTIETRWPNGCGRFSRTSVEEVDGGFLITPYDLDVEPIQGVCLMMPVRLTHTADLEFSEPQIARITIQGRHSTSADTLTQVHRSVTVLAN